MTGTTTGSTNGSTAGTTAGTTNGATAGPDSDALLEQRLEIETPERVVLVHDLAGIGSRFAAGSIDACILVVPWVVAVCVIMGVMPVSGTLAEAELQAVGLAVFGVCSAILWLYFLLFESLWAGRTPGKAMLRLRVMSVHGGPAPVSSVVLRNVLRVVDMLPAGPLHVLGGVSMFLSSRSQRVGDLAAGTVVVRERPESLRLVPLPSGAMPGDAFSASDLAETDRFMERRRELLPAARRRIADAIAGRLVAEHGLAPGPSETILGLVAARRSPQQIRDLAGPHAAPPGPVAAEPAAGPALPPGPDASFPPPPPPPLPPSQEQP